MTDAAVRNYGAPMDYAELDATDQAELVRAGTATPRELVDAAIERIEQVNGTLNAVIHPLYDRARALADGDVPDGPFRGVPMVVKDLDGFLAGAPLHQGNIALKEFGYVPERSSFLFERFERAGFIIVGKTNTPEFGLQPTTEPLAYGPTRNPWDTNKGTGGSSGGSAASVAAGLVPVGHAGDGGGSIRIPASACGLVGLKPSRGRVSVGPDEGEPWNGFVARLVVTKTVRDTASILDAVHGADPTDPYGAPAPGGSYGRAAKTPPRELRIGIMTEAPGGLVPVDPACVAATETTARVLESLGHRVEVAHPVALDDLSLLQFFATIVNTNVVRDLESVARIIGRDVTEADFEPSTWAFAESGRAVTGAEFGDALEAARQWSRAVMGWWSEFDILLTPTLAEPPPNLGDVQRGRDGDAFEGMMRSTAFIAFTAAFNVTGQPAISIPGPPTADGLPVGVQLVAAPWREDVCLALAGQLESAQPWADRRPAVFATR